MSNSPASWPLTNEATRKAAGENAVLGEQGEAHAALAPGHVAARLFVRRGFPTESHRDCLLGRGAKVKRESGG